MTYIDLGDERLIARLNINNGQLIGLSLDDKEFFHDGGSPDWEKNGWANSEIIMFPLVGPPKDYKVTIGSIGFPQDQHGISRILPFVIKQHSKGYVQLIQEYKPHNLRNPKYQPGNGHPEHLFWPFACSIEKEFKIIDDRLVMTLSVANNSSDIMPYRAGWHPGFRLQGSVVDGAFTVDDESSISLDEVINASLDPTRNAYALKDVHSVRYSDNKTGKGILVSSDDFKHMMLWSPGKDAGMFCIETATHPLGQAKGEELFVHGRFELLKPGERRSYSVVLKPF
ncbi:MAG: hypothetical protein V1866_06640 [archaeon]